MAFLNGKRKGDEEVRCILDSFFHDSLYRAFTLGSLLLWSMLPWQTQLLKSPLPHPTPHTKPHWNPFEQLEHLTSFDIFPPPPPLWDWNKFRPTEDSIYHLDVSPCVLDWFFSSQERGDFTYIMYQMCWCTLPFQTRHLNHLNIPAHISIQFQLSQSHMVTSTRLEYSLSSLWVELVHQVAQLGQKYAYLYMVAYWPYILYINLLFDEQDSIVPLKTTDHISAPLDP